MTLIATFRESRIPILIGDVLLSRTGVEQEHINIPTRDDVAAVLPPEWQRNVCSLHPKLTMINPHLALAWTGSHIAAKSLIEQVRANFGKSTEGLQNFFEYLNNYRETGIGQDLLIIGLLVQEGSAVGFRWDARSPQKVHLGDEFYEGSGAKHIEEAIKERASKAQGEGNEAIDSAVQTALSIVGSLLSDDLVSGESLQNLFGGGYQIIVYFQGRLVFVPDYLLFFLLVTVAGDQLKFQPATYFLKHTYLNDELIIKRTTFGLNNSNGILNDCYINAFIVTDKPAAEICLSRQDILTIKLRSMYYCCVALCALDDSSHACGVFVAPDVPDGMISIEDHYGKETLKLHRDLFANISNHFRALGIGNV